VSERAGAPVRSRLGLAALLGTRAGATARRIARQPSTVAAAIMLLLIVAAAVGASWITPYDPLRSRLIDRLQPPSLVTGHWFGTDQLGRDVLSRVIVGARVSLTVGAVAACGEGILGTALGLMAGYSRGIADTVIMRAVEIQLAFPFVVLALAIVAALGPGVGNLILVFIVTGWVVFARVVRAQVLQLREREFVEASRSLGATSGRVLLRHILPNITGSLIVIGSFELAKIIVWEASLSFLGLGVPPRTVSWGAMLSDGREYVDTAWWVATFPGLTLVAVVLAINTIGDALRDALDPRADRA
jgi:peptide/nickel transport system permease protein